MALTGDIKTTRYGTPGNSTQPGNLGITASAKIYRGSIATRRSGYLVAATAPASTDLTWGLIDKYGPGYADVAPGLVGGTSNGSVTAEIATGAFFLQNGSGASAFTQANVGAAAYVQDEQSMGSSQGSGATALPVGGQFLGMAANIAPNLPNVAGMIVVKIGSPAGSTGAPS